MRRLVAFCVAGGLAATPAFAAAPYDLFVAAGGNMPIAFGSEPAALKICNGNSYLVKIVVDGVEVRPRAQQCVIVVGKDIQAGRYAGTPPTTDLAAFTIKVEILGVKDISDD